jgi:hypothetical protein
MAGYQFLHVEAYAREESSKGRTQTKKNSDGTYTSKEVAKEKRGNVRWVIAEAKREQNSCHHIDSPQPPLVLLGDLDQVEQEATRWAEEATDERGRKLRKDGACLLAGVISLPRDEEAQWEQFKAKSVDWLKEKYGDNLRCVIAHEKDELHPHLHFYCVAKKGQKFEDLHEGKRAQKELKKKNPQASKQEQNIAFAEAMRATQDDFANRVGQRFGLARIGPGRRRLTRAQWQAEQAQAEALKNTLAKKNAYKKHYKKQAIAEAQQAIEQAIEQAKEQAKEQARAEGLAEAQQVGKKLGGLWSGVKDKLSGPTEREQQAIRQAQEAQAKAEEEARKAKVQADNRVSKVAEQLQAEQARSKALEKELKQAEQKLQDLAPQNQNRNRNGYGYGLK